MRRCAAAALLALALAGAAAAAARADQATETPLWLVLVEERLHAVRAHLAGDPLEADPAAVALAALADRLRDLLAEADLPVLPERTFVPEATIAWTRTVVQIRTRPEAGAPVQERLPPETPGALLAREPAGSWAVVATPAGIGFAVISQWRKP